MKIGINELKALVESTLAEAKKKKKKEELEEEATVHPAGYSSNPAFDFSAPLGAYNLYRSQGQVNFGPYTGPGTKIDDHRLGANSNGNSYQQAVFSEGVDPRSAWAPFVVVKPRAPQTIWEAADYLHEKKLGFKKLKGKLAHKKGVTDPAALAASIGRKKFGEKGMAKKAAAGKKK